MSLYHHSHTTSVCLLHNLYVFDVIVWPSSSLELCIIKLRGSDWLQIGRYGLAIPAGPTDISLSKTSRPLLGPTQSPSEWIPLSFLVMKRSWPEGNRYSVAPCWRTNGAVYVVPQHTFLTWTGTNLLFQSTHSILFFRSVFRKVVDASILFVFISISHHRPLITNFPVSIEEALDLSLGSCNRNSDHCIVSKRYLNEDITKCLDTYCNTNLYLSTTVFITQGNMQVTCFV